MNKLIKLLAMILLLSSIFACKSEIKREEFAQKHPYFTSYQKEQVLEGNIYLGMPKTSIKSIFGTPEKIEIVNVLNEKWIYTNMSLLVSKKGILKKIEN